MQPLILSDGKNSIKLWNFTEQLSDNDYQAMQEAKVGHKLEILSYDFELKSFNWDKSQGMDIKNIPSKDRKLRVEINPQKIR